MPDRRDDEELIPLSELGRTFLRAGRSMGDTSRLFHQLNDALDSMRRNIAENRDRMLMEGLLTGHITIPPTTADSAMPRRRTTPPAENSPPTVVALDIFSPAERPEGQVSMVAREDIEYRSLQPTAEFIESIRTFGVLQPIAVVVTSAFGEPIRYRCVAGRRRMKAAEIVGLSYVPALIFPAGTADHVIAGMAITENVQRRDNPLTDLQAIEAMVRVGATEQQIAEQLHLPIGVLRSRMRLAGLIPELRAALEEGMMTASVALQAARLPTPRQRRLVREWGRQIRDAERHGDREPERVRITAPMVREVMQAVQQQAADAQIGDAVFEPLPVVNMRGERVDRTERTSQPVDRIESAPVRFVNDYDRAVQVTDIVVVRTNDDGAPALITAFDGLSFVNEVNVQAERAFTATVRAQLEEARRRINLLESQQVQRAQGEWPRAVFLNEDRTEVAVEGQTYIALGQVSNEVGAGTAQVRRELAAAQAENERLRAQIVDYARMEVPAIAVAGQVLEVANGLTREQIIAALIEQESLPSVQALIRAAIGSMPVAPNPQTIRLADALTMVDELVAEAVRA